MVYKIYIIKASVAKHGLQCNTNHKLEANNFQLPFLKALLSQTLKIINCRLVNTIGLERGLDTLVWQLIASVAAPGYTIHTIVGIVTKLLNKAEEIPQIAAQLVSLSTAVGISPDVFITTFNKSLPTAVGLLTIPFIVHPIDGAVHATLNVTLRPVMRRYICEAAGGDKAGLAICNCTKD